MTNCGTVTTAEHSARWNPQAILHVIQVQARKSASMISMVWIAMCSVVASLSITSLVTLSVRKSARSTSMEKSATFMVGYNCTSNLFIFSYFIFYFYCNNFSIDPMVLLYVNLIFLDNTNTKKKSISYYSQMHFLFKKSKNFE